MYRYREGIESKWVLVGKEREYHRRRENVLTYFYLVTLFSARDTVFFINLLVNDFQRF